MEKCDLTTDDIRDRVRNILGTEGRIPADKKNRIQNKIRWSIANKAHQQLYKCYLRRIGISGSNSVGEEYIIAKRC